MARETVAIWCRAALGAVALWVPALPTGVQAQILTAATVSGERGQTVWFNVTLDPQGISVAGTLNTIEFNPLHTPIKECQAASKVRIYGFLPSPCGSAGQPACTAVRVLIMDPIGQPPAAILTPTVLYQCRVDIPPAAAVGGYPLVVSDTSASDPAGNRKALVAVNGGIWVVDTSGCAIGRADRGWGWVLGVGLLLGLGLRVSAGRGPKRRPRGVARLWVAIVVATMASRAVAQPCTGDCNGNLAVTVDEILVAVNIALGTVPVGSCLAADANSDGEVTVDEILLQVNRALFGCPGAPATATSTPTSGVATPTPTVASNLAQLEVQVDNPSDTSQQVCVWGTICYGGMQGACSDYGCAPVPAQRVCCRPLRGAQSRPRRVAAPHPCERHQSVAVSP